jgi:protein TonB
MSSRTYISIAASLALHVFAFLTFAGVKIYRELRVEDSMSVEFVAKQEVKPLRRSLLVRPMISVDKSAKNRPPERNFVRADYDLSGEVYFIAPEKEFSAVKGLEREMFLDTEIRRPDVDYENRASVPMKTELLKEPHLRGIQVQPRIYQGSDLLSDIAPAQAKPDMVRTEDALRKFAAVVRKEIESQKRYPPAAQSSGVEGRARVKVTISKDGKLENAEIIESSGYEILDKAALQSVKDAAPFPPIPEAVKRNTIQMSIRLNFRLSV